MYDETRKYWIFYEKDKDDPTKLRDIYAYTDKKEYARRFQEERNMSMFFCQKEILTNEEYRDLNYNYVSCMLRPSEIQMYDKKEQRFYTTSYMMTEGEHNHVSSSLNLLMTLSSHCWTNPRIFQDKLYKALTILEYTSIYNNLIAKKEFPMENDTKLQIDQLGVFIHWYGKTLKG